METENVPHLNHLVIVAPNWLGDAVMALPAIADIRRACPDLTIAVSARPPIAPLFELVPGVNDVVAAPPPAGRSFDAALLLPNSFHSALAAWRAGIAQRWGYGTDLRGFLLTRAIRAPRPQDHLHQAAAYQRLVRELGYPSGPLQPQLTVPPRAREAAADLLVSAGWDRQRPLVALAPGAAYGGAKRWPPGSFAAVAERLARDGAAVVLVGSAADARAGQEVERASGAPLINLMGRTDLSTLAGVLVQCRALATNDSGAMHVAAALGVAVTAMFGPTDERETRPVGSADPAVLTHAVWCRPCMLRECPIGHGCMQGIAADDVLAAVRRTL